MCLVEAPRRAEPAWAPLGLALSHHGVDYVVSRHDADQVAGPSITWTASRRISNQARRLVAAGDGVMLTGAPVGAPP